MPKFKVQGGVPLKGEVKISGAKNAALPILAATLLATEPCTLTNVPDISDVHTFLGILKDLGAEATFTEGTVKIDTRKVRPSKIKHEQVKKMRASILLLGPLLGRFKEVSLAFPGGCVLGKRSVHAHLHALEKLGARIQDEKSEEDIHLKTTKLIPADFIMWEASVTATENALMAAVMAEGTSQIRWAAMEPHVQDLCHFLVALGAKIEGIGTPTLTVHGAALLTGTEYEITPDYLETGTLALAGVLTKGHIKLTFTRTNQLDSFWQKLEEVGASFHLKPSEVEIKPTKHFKAIEKLQTAVFPGFATDLQAPFTVLLTQCEGVSKVYETLFEGRLNYLYELERMGANIEIQNPHQALIHGPKRLKGTEIASNDIRAGAAMVLAALIAEGETIISDINYIDRGYERIDEKLRHLGAKITRQ
ncbi:UDP-N-acetylglucosamine 1-carboxyvinyltransferase [Patescibacteria group bacterium]|nr:UDP-N-acetylglucosamine 1-carboxyvinyltransferase [Patescibacteria group bacterium]